MKANPVSSTPPPTEKIIEWACSSLSSLGYTLKSNAPENLLNTPWSYVARFETSDGYVYLKQTPPLLSLEAKIIQVLHDRFQAPVPTVIAHNPELNCFLMKDAGRPLRPVLKQKFDTDLFCRAVNVFTSLQLATAENVDVLLDIGVPDWRLEKLPGLYRDLISQKDILLQNGLTETEIGELEALLPTVSGQCSKLSACFIPQTIVQPDFNDNNTLIDEASQALTIIDLGEIVISHPFFSLVNCLKQLKKHHGLSEKDDAYVRIMDACLENFMNPATRKELDGAFATARVLWLVYDMLGHHRLMQACDKDTLATFQNDKFRNTLKEFIAVCHSL